MTAGNDRHVWVFGYADVLVYAEDGSGNPAGSPFLTYCYMEDVRVEGKLEVINVKATGRPSGKLHGRSYNYSMSVGCIYFEKSKELDVVNMFKRNQRLQLVLQLTDPEYTGTAPQENDSHTLIHGLATSWEITGRDNQNVQMKATFEAEDFS